MSDQPTSDEDKSAVAFTNSPERIWLEPVDGPYSPDVTRMWCDDDVWGPEEPGVPYIRADLTAQRPASDGWQTVPVEPTEAMVKAATERTQEAIAGGWHRAHPETLWQTMLAAAPAPPGATASLPEPKDVPDVVAKLRELGGHSTAAALCDALVRVGYLTAQCQLAIQRATDKGQVKINADWTLSLPEPGADGEVERLRVAVEDQAQAIRQEREEVEQLREALRMVHKVAWHMPTAEDSAALRAVSAALNGAAR